MTSTFSSHVMRWRQWRRAREAQEWDRKEREDLARKQMWGLQ